MDKETVMHLFPTKTVALPPNIIDIKMEADLTGLINRQEFNDKYFKLLGEYENLHRKVTVLSEIINDHIVNHPQTTYVKEEPKKEWSHHTGYPCYCVKCKQNVHSDNGKIKVSDSGRRMYMGVCPTCGTKVNRILGKE